jgi:hypothetical protein
MRRLVALIIACCAVLSSSYAQYGNEWINFNQEYVKIPVGKDGIYRVSHQALNSIGFPVSTLNPKKLQLFHRGVEQAILITGENDGRFDAGDVIDFYGRKNDGTLDKQLYIDPSSQPHHYYNLYSDTTSYFLTVGSANGKRISFYQESNTGLNPEAYHLDEKMTILANNFSHGKDYGQILYSSFDEGEGWMSQIIAHSQAAASFSITNIVRQIASQPQPILEVLTTGRGPQQHTVQIFVGQASRLLTTQQVSGYQSIKIAEAIQWSDIDSNGNLAVSVKVSGAGGPARVSVNYLKLSYAQELDIAGSKQAFFTLRENTATKSLLQIKNPLSNSRIFDVTDPANVIQVGGQSSTTLDAVVRSTNVSRKLAVVAEPILPALQRISFTAINGNSFNYLIITHPLLRKAANGYSDPVQAYADYRASETGGGFSPRVVNIHDLYNQFSYGEQTPLAIFQLMKSLEATKLPDYLFLIGKGLDVAYNYYRKPGDFPVFKDLVPTAGSPSSDIAFTAGLAGTTFNQAVATGRLTSTTSQEVAAYLNKVKETEARPFDDLRRKHILHLSGGIEVGEPQAFRSYLEEFAQSAKKFYLGGVVQAVAKQSTDIKLINISEEVNSGVNLVTFFGHSSPATLDFDVGYVSDPVMKYDNKGKYPVMLMNGCDAGAFFLNAELFGEDWINTADKGAIGFIAHTSFGFAHTLRKYSGLFYRTAYEDSTFITKGIGDIQKEVSRRFLRNVLPDELNIAQVQQMLLLGDPAVRLFGAPHADYAVQDENVFLSALNDNPVTAAADSFALTFIVRNYGQAKEDRMAVNVIRTFSDRSTVTYDSIYDPVFYSDTLRFIIRDKNLKGVGNNTFEIRVDAGNQITELREDNNAAYLDYFIPLNGTQNLYPRKFSIVNVREVSLSFQHTDILSNERQFLIEVDTTDSFDSPFKKIFNVNASVLARHAIQLLEQDTLTYYWRTKLKEPLENESKDWATSSFTYIKGGPEGWAQIHFPQFSENASTGLVRDPVLRNIKFQETVTPLAIKTFGADSPELPNTVSIKINNAEYNLHIQGFGCRDNTINLIAFDRRSTVPYVGLPFTWYNRAGRSCGREPWAINSFDASQLLTGNGDDIIQYIENIALGDSVVMFTIGDPNFANWPQEVLSKLGDLGISIPQIQELQPGEPIVISARKGIMPGDAKVNRVEDDAPQDKMLEVGRTVTGRYNSGEMKSVLIGPANLWKTMSGKISDKEIVDQVKIEVYAISISGSEKFIATYENEVLDISSIDAKAYPYLKLVYNTFDDVNLTATQLDQWIVTFEPVAEGLIFYNGDIQQQKLSEGEVWTGQYGFVNVTDREFPAEIPVTLKVFNHTTLTSSDQSLSIAPPAPGDTTRFNVTINSASRKGLNDVEVFVNPYVHPEQYYENNVLKLNKHLNIIAEVFSPVLDVTFDGRYIERDEFINPNPEIRIELWDENRTLIKKDTSGINVLLAYPCDTEECSFRRINFNRSDVLWKAATDTSNFSISFTPENLTNGKYILRIEAKDQSGNESGAVPFEISFQVKSETGVTMFDPFPNPVSRETNFKINHTGVNDPETIEIQIITLNGNLIEKLEYNDLHVGTNLITWSTLKSGALLPNGIYIYKMMLKANGSVFQKRGKISIVR